MKETIAGLIVVGIIAVAMFFFGRSTIDQGISEDTVADLLREAGDSAVTAYLSSEEMTEFVEEALSDTVEFYNAAVESAARIVVRRDTIRLADTVLVDVVRDPATRDDTVTIPLPTIDSVGIVLAESLTIAPNPIFFLRHAQLSFDPDTLLVAMLKTEEGIDRFTAAATREGLSVGVADAAQARQSDHRVLRSASTLFVALGCGISGWFLGRDETTPALIAGGVCATGIGLKLGIPRL